jgi:hypothetical protein
MLGLDSSVSSFPLLFVRGAAQSRYFHGVVMQVSMSHAGGRYSKKKLARGVIWRGPIPQIISVDNLVGKHPKLANRFVSPLFTAFPQSSQLDHNI